MISRHDYRIKNGLTTEKKPSRFGTELKPNSTPSNHVKPKPTTNIESTMEISKAQALKNLFVPTPKGKRPKLNPLQKKIQRQKTTETILMVLIGLVLLGIFYVFY